MGTSLKLFVLHTYCGSASEIGAFRDDYGGFGHMAKNAEILPKRCAFTEGIRDPH